MDDKYDDLLLDGVKRIRQLIKDKNLKQIDLVDALGVSKKTVTQWLQGSSIPSAQHLIELAKILGVSERWVFEGKEESKKTAFHQDPRPCSADLSLATVEQLMAEIKARYAALNLNAEISIQVTPIAGGFVHQSESTK